MWQRFTERARRVVFFAQEEAARLGENYVGTEHLLLGLIREPDSVGARLLDAVGIPLARVRSDIERQVTRGHGNLGQDMQLTPRSKRVIDLAYEEARLLNNNYIGTEHFLLGLIREGDGLAARVLVKLGTNLERVRAIVVEWQEANPPDGDAPRTLKGRHREALLRDLNWVLYHAHGAVAADGIAYVEPEDLLQRIVTDKGNNAAIVLAELGADTAAIQAALQRPAPTETRPEKTQLAPRTKQVLALAFAEFAGSERGNVGSEYLLIGILREGETGKSQAAELLAGQNVDLERLRKAIAALEADAPAKKEWRPESLLEHALAAYQRPGLSAARLAELPQADANAAVSRAAAAARAAGKIAVGSDHLLLGIIGDPQSRGAQALTRLGVDLAQVLQSLEGADGSTGPEIETASERPEPAGVTGTPEPVAAPDRLPLSTVARQIIQDAVTLYVVHNQNEFHSGHLLLALLPQWTGRAGRVLAELGVTADKLMRAMEE